MKVSVIMPVNKSNPYLFSAINSILTQTYNDFEFIIVLNGGDEQFKSEVYSKYLGVDKVRVISTEFYFLPFALNYAVQCSYGSVIVRMDSDDISEPTRIERIVSCFLASDYDVVYSNYFYIDECDNVLGISSVDKKNLKRWLPFRCIIPHPTCAYKKNVLMQSGGYMYGVLSEDYDLWLRLVRQDDVKFYCLPEALLKYRVHDGQVTNKSNLFRIFIYDFSLKLRELFISKKSIYLVALLVLPFDVLYQYLLKCKTKRIKK